MLREKEQAWRRIEILLAKGTGTCTLMLVAGLEEKPCHFRVGICFQRTTQLVFSKQLWFEGVATRLRGVSTLFCLQLTMCPLPKPWVGMVSVNLWNGKPVWEDIVHIPQPTNPPPLLSHTHTPFNDHLSIFFESFGCGIETITLKMHYFNASFKAIPL